GGGEREDQDGSGRNPKSHKRILRRVTRQLANRSVKIMRDSAMRNGPEVILAEPAWQIADPSGKSGMDAGVFLAITEDRKN
ncbi:MAG: hypothetical protein JSS13_12180, partial [Proteobacteria bacterium]|nr:hypothetical protein [Pseudomonadota bacterium]